MSKKTEKKESKAIEEKPVEIQEEKTDSEKLAQALGIHRFYLARIRRAEGLERNFLTTSDELLKLYKKHCEEGE